MDESKITPLAEHVVLNSIPDAIIIIDIESRILFLNDQALKFQTLIDCSLKPGAIIHESVCLEWSEIFKNAIRSVVKTKASITFETDYCYEGRNIYFDIRCNPVLSQCGVVQIILEARDITFQKIFENKITTIANDLSNLIEHANALIIGIDSGGNVIDWNDFTSEISGYSKSESLTRHFSDFLSKEDHAKFFEGVNVVLNGGIITSYELRMRAKDSES